MRSFARPLCLVLLLSLAIPLANAQYSIREERPRLSRALTGHVFVGPEAANREPLSDITVELCTPNWQSVLTSTKTDKNGYFLLEKPASGKLFYLRFRASGFNPYELRVRIKRFGPKELKLYMQIAA